MLFFVEFSKLPRDEFFLWTEAFLAFLLEPLISLVVLMKYMFSAVVNGCCFYDGFLPSFE
jgi:hypothetical protein